MRTFIEMVVLPPTGFFVLAAFGLLLIIFRIRFGYALCILSLLLLYAFSTPIVARLIAEPLAQYPALQKDQFANDVGAIVVLGAGRYYSAPEFGGDTIRGAGLERVRYAAWLHRQTGRPILVSGGDINGRGSAEATLMKEALEKEFGVTVAWVEPASRNTAENATMSHAILDKAGIKKIYLVTHAEHMTRAVEAFSRTPLVVIPAPTIFGPELGIETLDFVPSGGAMTKSNRVLHEWLGRAWYALAE